MENLDNLGLVELTQNDLQQITGGMEIGWLKITASVTTNEATRTLMRAFSILLDESGISLEEITAQ